MTGDGLGAIHTALATDDAATPRRADGGVYFTVSGRTEIVTDPAGVSKAWRPTSRRWFAGSRPTRGSCSCGSDL